MKNLIITTLISLSLITTGRAQIQSDGPNTAKIFYDPAESVPPISWPTSKTKGYMMFTGGSQVFGDMSSPTNGTIVKQGEYGAPAPRAGKSMYRFHVERRPDLAPQYCRSEMYWGNGDGEVTGARWYAVSMYLPTDWGFDTRPIGLGYDFKFPDAQGPANLNLKLINDRLNITHQYPQGAQEKYYDIGKVVLGQWMDFAIYFKRSTGPDGLIEVYINKKKVLTVNGPNSAAKESYILFGPYKWQYITENGQGEGPGTYNGPITVFYDEIKIGGESATIESISPGGSVVTPPPPPPPVNSDTTFSVVAGSATDRNYSGGSVYTVNGLTERFGNFSYNIPLVNGKYKVDLNFSEIFFSSSNMRLFNVGIEGKQVLTSFDIFKSAGAKNKVITQTFETTVSDGALNVAFTSVKDNAKISSIIVSPAAPVVIPPPPVDNAIRLVSVKQGTKVVTIGSGTNTIQKTIVIAELQFSDGSTTIIEKK